MSRGEVPDLAALYTRYSAAIHRRARFLLKDSEEALDVTQETFIAFMHDAVGGYTAASPFTVLYQIATYKAVDRLRSRSRWSGTLSLLDRLDTGNFADVQESVASSEGGLARVEALQDLAILTHGEKPQALTAAVLYFAEDHTMEEIAMVLRCSRRTIAKLLRQFAARARKRTNRLDKGSAR